MKNSNKRVARGRRLKRQGGSSLAAHPRGEALTRPQGQDADFAHSTTLPLPPSLGTHSVRSLGIFIQKRDETRPHPESAPDKDNSNSSPAH
jgi:hypothetical protein